MRDRLRSFDWGILLAIVLPIVVALPTWGDGIAAGADVAVHVHRIHAMSQAIAQGNWYPRWISYLHLGYGYPIFNFYAPGYVYITALFELAGLDISLAYNLVQTLAWSFGSVGMYLLARRLLPVQGAVLAAALWVYAPSRLYEVWWQGSLAQIVAAALIPYILLGVIRYSQAPTLRHSLFIALSYAAVIFSHTPMMYISTLYAAPLVLVLPLFITRCDLRQSVRLWLGIGLSFSLGVLLAAIFLLPMIAELPYVQISQGIDETTSYLQEQYLTLQEIFSLPRLLDRSDYYLDFPRSLGLVGGGLSLLGILALAHRRQYGALALLVSGLAFTIFMMLSSSFDLWLTIPAFANLRFPARLLRIGAVFIGLLGGASLLLLPKRWHTVGLIVGLFIVIGQVLPLSQPYDVWLQWDKISAYDELLHEETARTWGTVSYDEFNPIWGERIFLDMPSQAERYRDAPFHLRVFGRDIAAVNWQGFSEENLADHTLRVTTDIDRAVRFRQYYFPGWQATVNGAPVNIYPDEEIGLITIDLPAGEHIVTLSYVGTAVQRLGAVLSGIGLVIVLVMAVASWRHHSLANTVSQTRLSAPVAFALSMGLIGVAIINVGVLQAQDWLMMQSPATEPQAMQTRVDAVFGEAVVLLGYSLHDHDISPNQPLAIDLYWHVPEAIDQNYRPLVQVVNVTQSAAWATSSRLQPAGGEFSTYMPDMFARDPYRLRLFDSEIAPYVGQIMVQVIGEAGALPLADGSDRLILPPVIRIDSADDRQQVETRQAPYRVGDVAALRCASVERRDDEFVIDLAWELLAASPSELVVMVQGLDQAGNLVASGDAPPFGGNYPAAWWQAGQILFDQQHLAASDAVQQIAIGLYERQSGNRLMVLHEDEILPNQQIILTLEDNSCQR